MNSMGINVMIIHCPYITNGFNPIYMYMQVISINHTSKSVHRSVRIGFELNPHPTRPNQVEQAPTHYGPRGWLDRGRSKLQQMLGGSVRVKDLENSENLVRKKIEKQSKSSETKVKKCWNSVRSCQIWQDLSHFHNLNLARSTKSCWKNIWVGRFKLLKFERRKTDIWPAILNFWKNKPVANHQRSWFGQRWVRFS